MKCSTPTCRSSHIKFQKLYIFQVVESIKGLPTNKKNKKKKRRTINLTIVCLKATTAEDEEEEHHQHNRDRLDSHDEGPEDVVHHRKPKIRPPPVRR